jgi:hypothetical protein
MEVGNQFHALATLSPAKESPIITIDHIAERSTWPPSHNCVLTGSFFPDGPRFISSGRTV